MDYLDFELDIGPGLGGREYPLVVVRSPAGEARETLHFPFSELELDNRLKDLQIALLRAGGPRRKVLTPEEQAVQGLGRALYDALLTGEVRVRYDVSYREARARGRGLRLKLRIRAPELAALPWELLYDAKRAEYVCLSSVTPVVRYPELPRVIQPLTVAPPLRILGMVASPKNLAPLNVTREKQRVEEGLADLRDEGLVELTWLPGQTWRDLQRALRRETWHVFHFIGHGGFDPAADEGLIALCDDQGRAQHLHATRLGRLLANHTSLRLALLNACEGARASDRDIFSSSAAILVRRGLPAVLAMQHEITDRAAIEFARTFYEALADGLPVDAAVGEARVAISVALENSVEWHTPVLYMRAADGVLFEVEETSGVMRQTSGVMRQTSGVMRQTSGAGRETTGVKREMSQVEREEATEAGRVEAPEVVVPGAKRAPEPEALPQVLTPREDFEPEMVLIPAGPFLMGSDPQKDKYVEKDEQPQHELALPDYYIARTPVTNAQYAAFVRAKGHRAPKHWDGDQPPRDKRDHPVVYVSWDDAMAYCVWLREVTGRSYVLPSEAEWEKAARGPDGRIYPWGDKWDAGKCNSSEGGKGGTTPVGVYPQGASPYEVLDMAGNVWEWTRSLKRDYPYVPGDGREDVDADGFRVVRGGAFNNPDRLVRCAYRLRYYPGPRGVNLGFRVVVVAAPIPLDSGNSGL